MTPSIPENLGEIQPKITEPYFYYIQTELLYLPGSQI